MDSRDEDRTPTMRWSHDGRAPDEGPDALAADTASLLGPGTMVDHFVVVRLVGRGGMGEVYLARDTKLGRKVALKVVQPRRMGSRDAAERFLFEAQTTARFSHPHIVAIHAVGEYRERPYVALEYLEGQTLRERFEQEPPSPRETMRFGLAIAEALAEAHRGGVLHRDLKPENVLIPRDGRLRVVDFGLAKSVGSPDALGSLGGGGLPEVELASGVETEGKRLCGTPAYMAPEQWEASGIAEPADIWALGVLLYELVLGFRPYQDHETHPMTLALKVTSPEPIPVPEAFSEVPTDLADLILRCLAKDPEERPSAADVVRALQAMLHGGRELLSEESPFRGLQPFTERHAHVFFGRDAEIAAFLERVREEPVLPVVGPSGAGKSSFVQAGVIPRLREQASWMVLALRPGNDPFVAVAQRLLTGESTARWRSTRTSGSDRPVPRRASISRLLTAEMPDPGEVEPPSSQADTVAVEPALREEPAPLDPLVLAGRLRESPALLGLMLQQLAERERCRVLLFVDQAEELVSMVDDERERAAFMQAICTAADDPLGPVRVVFTLRDDFLGRLALGPEVREALGRVTVVRSPGTEALAEILLRPLDAVDYRFDDPGLVDEMIAEVAGEPACLPLLQFAVRTLWDRRDRKARLLQRVSYEAIGGVAGALAEHAEGVLEGLSPEQIRQARELLLRLVTPEGTRRVVGTEDALEGLGPGADEVLARLTASRLVSVSKGGDEDAAGARLELVHESLIARWAQLAHWIEEGREELVFLAEVGQAAELWEKRGAPAEEVWHGEALHEAQRLLGRISSPVPARIGRFLAAGEQQEQRKQRTRRLAWAAAIGGLVLITLVSVIAALTLAESEQVARNGRATAEAQRASAQREGARAALARGDLLEARALLRGSLETEDSPLARALWWRLSRDPLLWHRELGSLVNALAFSPDGQTLAAACGDRAIYLFDVTTREARVLRGHDDQVYAVDFSPDGRQLASASWSGTIRLWDLASGEATLRKGHVGAVNYLRYSPDGRWLASTGHDRTIRIWDLQGDAEPVVLDGHQDRVYGVAWRPDGARLATGGWDRVVRVWDTATWRELRALRGHEGSVANVAYSPDGHQLASGSADRTVRLWDADSGALQHVLRGHEGKVWDLAYSPDGARLATASFGGTVMLWDPRAGGEPILLGRSDDGLYAVAYRPDGAAVATGGADKTVRLWDTRRAPVRRVDRGHTAQVVGLAFRPDGAELASGGADRTVRVWDVARGEQRLVLDDFDQGITSLDYAPDGRRLAVGSWSDTVDVWDLALAEAERHLEGHALGVRAVRYDPTGTRLATCSTDHTIKLWDPLAGTLRRTLVGHHDTVNDVAFSPDGRWVASVGHDRSVRIWDAASGRLRQSLAGHHGMVRGVSFVPGRGQVVSTSDDGTVRLWDLASGQGRVLAEEDARAYYPDVSPDGRLVGVPLSDGTARLIDLDSGDERVLAGHAGEVNALRFRPDGAAAATVSDDGTVRLWDTDGGRPLWRAPMLHDDPVEVLTHTGWHRLDDGEAPPAEPTAWRTAVEQRAAAAARADDGSVVCLLDRDGQLEVWNARRDQRVATHALADARRVLAVPGGCVALHGEGGGSYGLTGAVHDLPAGTTAVGRGGDLLLVAAGDEIVVRSLDGEDLGRHPVGRGVTALTRSGDWLVAGFEDGNLELVPTQPWQAKPSFIYEDVPSSPVVSLLAGPMDTLIAGYANGLIGIWNRDNGTRLDHARLHGPVTHLLLREHRLYAASELGDHLVVDLDVFYDDYCALVRRVWDDVPVVWKDGLPLREEPDAAHACAGTAVGD